jgi:MFS family permease
MSDIFGRKQAILVAMAFFVVFSLACSFAQTIEEL